MAPDAKPAVEVTRRLFTVDDYYRMADAGIFSEDDRVELIEGEIVRIAPIGSRHADIVDQINRFFIEHLTSDRARVRIQNPVRLNDRTELQPDVVLVLPRLGGYRSVHPGPRDVQLTVEVADTSLASDRDVKLEVNARAGVPEVWIIDVTSQVIEVYYSQLDGSYTQHSSVGADGVAAPRAFTEARLPVAAIFG